LANVIAFDIPAGTTVKSLVETVFPAIHARLVSDDAPTDPFSVVVRIDDAGSWTVTIRGRAMQVVDGEIPRPALWLFTTARTVERFLEDATGEQRFLPKIESGAGISVLSDPRLVKRVTMAHGRIELALRDVDGERLAVVLGFGDAARRRLDPDDADVVVEAGLGTVERILAGKLAPESALVDGDVTVRGNRMLALQLALAVAPFYPTPKR
jgi:hypothetical protein